MSFIDPRKPLVALVDCNNFFVSCERAFDPKLIGRPVVVLSSNDGCVVSRSNEAKKIGVPMGVPFFQIRDLAQKEGVIARSSNFKLYGDMSRRVMRLLAEATSHLDVYSVDEAFIMPPSTNDPIAWGLSLRTLILRATGIPVSIGIARTKTLAKVAAHQAKQSVVGISYFETDGQVKASLGTLPINEVWGIGRQFAARMKSADIHTAGDFVEASDRMIQGLMGVYGMRIKYELSGIPSGRIPEEDTARKSIISSRSFGRSVGKLIDLEEAVSGHALRISEKARGDGSAISGLSVSIREGRHVSSSPYRASGFEQFAAPTSDTFLIISAAKRILGRIYRGGLAYKKVGVSAFGVAPEGSAPTETLFGDGAHSKNRELFSIIDALNRRYHKRIVVPLASLPRDGEKAPWLPKRENVSPEYTTRWDALLTVSA